MEDIKEPFNAKKAEKLLKEGYYVRSNDWPTHHYVYLEDFVLYNQEDEEVGFNLIFGDKRGEFSLFYEEDEECQEKEEMTASSGILEHGELKRQLKDSEKEIESVMLREESAQSRELRKGQKTENITGPTSNPSMPKTESDITKTQKETLKEEGNGQRITERGKMQLKENITTSTEMISSPRSSRQESSEIQQLDSTHASELLKEENSTSIQLLDNSAKQLISYAESLAAPQTRCMETGEVIKAAPTHQVMDAVKCLDAARNMMKTKLEFMKFGKDLIDSKIK